MGKAPVDATVTIFGSSESRGWPKLTNAEALKIMDFSAIWRFASSKHAPKVDVAQNAPAGAMAKILDSLGNRCVDDFVVPPC